MNSRERTILVFLIAVLLVGVAVNAIRHEREQARLRIIQVAQTSIPAPQSAESAESADKPENVDINSATATELELLPGIGPALAQRIIDYRSNNGPFKVEEDLLKVSGIGPKKLAAIRARITVSPPSDTR
jgi:competence protein ComEA